MWRHGLEPEAVRLELLLEGFEFASEVVSGIRTIRKEKNIAFKNTIEFLVLNNESQTKGFDAIISKIRKHFSTRATQLKRLKMRCRLE